MEDKLFSHNIIIYIEKYMTKIFSFNLIIDGFNNLKEQKVIYYIYIYIYIYIYYSYNYIKLYVHFYYIRDR